jgi:hypothetical protein
VSSGYLSPRCDLAKNEEGNTGKLTRRSSVALAASRWLAAAASFILLVGSAYDFSNNPPATKSLLAGAAASPRAHRLLQFTRGSVETRARERARVSSLQVRITMI